MNFSRISGIAGIVGPAAFIALPAVVESLQVGYDPVHQTVSQLVATPQGGLVTAGMAAFAVLVVVFTIGLHRRLRPSRLRNAASIMLGAAAISVLAVAFLPNEVNPAVYTIPVILHKVLARVGGAFFPIAAICYGLAMRADPAWRLLSTYTLVAAGIASLMGLVHAWMLISVWALVWNGIFERVFLWNLFIWLAVISVQLLMPSRRETERA